MTIKIKSIKYIYEIMLDENIPLVFNKLNYYKISIILIFKLKNKYYINGYNIFEKRIFTIDISEYNEIIYTKNNSRQLLNII